MNPKTRLAVVAEYSDSVSAHIAMGVLRTNGIECTLNNEIIAGVLAVPTAQYDQIRLVVREQDLAKARCILQSSAPVHPLCSDD